MPFHWSPMRASWVRAVFVVLGASAGLQAQSPRVIYTWSGTDNTRGWTANSPLLTVENTIAGELTLTEIAPLETDVAVNDDFNNIVETSPIIGGTKLEHLVSAGRALALRLTPEETATLEAPYRPHPVKGHSS